MSGSLFAFLRRLAWVLCSPLVVPGILGIYMLGGEDYYDGSLGQTLAGNVVWLVLLTVPIWGPLALLWWIVTGKSVV